MEQPIPCRYCGEPFIPQIGKPGYRDECPECLYLKSAPMIKPAPLDSLTVEQRSAVDEAVKTFRTSLRKLGFPKDEIKLRVARYALSILED